MMSDLSHTFDWHKEEHPSMTFKAWLFVRLIENMDLEELREATDKFTNVTLDISINGRPIDAEKFINSLEETIENETRREAETMVREIPQLHELTEFLTDLTTSVKQEVYYVAEAAGLDMSGDD